MKKIFSILGQNVFVILALIIIGCYKAIDIGWIESLQNVDSLFIFTIFLFPLAGVLCLIQIVLWLMLLVAKVFRK